MALRQADGTVVIDTRLDTRGVENGIKQLTPSLKKIGALVAAAFSIRALVNFGKQAVEIASDIEEVQNVVDVAFGDMAYKMEEFADKAIQTYGISKLVAKQTGSTYMSMARGMGLAMDTATDMSLSLTALSADMASFYNVEQDVARTALNSVFTGETETLKRYGIVMTQTNLDAFALSQGITKSYQSMSQAEKVQLRYNYVMAQTSLAQGDFARTSNSWANQVRILKENWKEFLSVVGTGLINVLTPLLSLLNSIVSYMTQLANAISKVFGGKTIQATNTAANNTLSMADNTSDYADATTDATKATKKLAKAQRGLSSLDELNVISSDISADSGATGTGSALGNLSAMVSGNTAGDIKEVGEETESTLVKALGKLADIDLTNLITAFNNLKEPLKELGGNIAEGLKFLYNEVLVPFAAWTIEDVLPAFLNILAGAISLVNAVIDTAKPVLEWLWDKFLKPIAEWTGGILVDVLNDFAGILKAIANNQTAVDVITAIVLALGGLKLGGAILNGVTQLGVWLTELSTMGQIAVGIAVAITGWEVGKSLFEWVTGETVEQSFGEMMSEIGEAISSGEIWDALKLMFSDWWDDVKQIFGVVGEWFGEKFSKAWEAIKKPFIKVGEFFGNVWTYIKNSFADTVAVFKEIFNSVWTNIKKPFEATWSFFSNVWSKIKSAFSYTVTWFKNTFTNAWNGIKGAFSNVWSFFSNVWTNIKKAFSYTVTWFGTTFSNAWSKVKSAFSGVRTFFTSVWSGIKGAFAHVSDWFKNTFTGAWTAVKNVFSKGGSIFVDIKDGVLDGLKAIINGLIKGINSVIAIPFNAINTALNKIKNAKIAGSYPFQNKIKLLDVPKIPELATGAVLPPNKPFYAMVGDQKHGTNIEAPLDTIVEAFKLANKDSQQKVVFEIVGDPTGMFKVMQKEANAYTRRTGRPAYS